MDDVTVLQLLVEGQGRLESKVDQLITEKACRKDVADIIQRLGKLEQSEAASRARSEQRLSTEKQSYERSSARHNKVIAIASGLSVTASFALNLPHYL